MQLDREQRFWILLTVFIAGVAILNVISTKLAVFSIAGITLTFSAGIVAYGLTFPITDAVAEVLGARRAKAVVWLGFFANVLVVGMTATVVRFTPSESMNPELAEAYGMVLGSVPRILIASMAAYLLAQLHDLWAFHFWKRITGGKHLWIRNNMSTVTSQLLDTTTFTLVAFAGSIAWSELPLVIFGSWVTKLFVALLDTPVVYFLVSWLRNAPAPVPDETAGEPSAA
jgi:hypothetical protein